jgi:hypothetical protein
LPDRSTEHYLFKQIKNCSPDALNGGFFSVRLFLALGAEILKKTGIRGTYVHTTLKWFKTLQATELAENL